MLASLQAYQEPVHRHGRHHHHHHGSRRHRHSRSHHRGHHRRHRHGSPPPQLVSPAHAMIPVHAAPPDIDVHRFIEEANHRITENDLPPPDAFPPVAAPRIAQPIQTRFTAKVPRQVKVPTVEQREITETTLEPITTTHLVNEVDFEAEEEVYTEMVERTGVRMREVIIKTHVPETYTEMVPVQLKRQVVRPITRPREIQTTDFVPRQQRRLVDVPGYRVDTIEEDREVVVEGYQTFEPTVQYHRSGFHYDTARLGAAMGHVHKVTGERVYAEHDVRGLPHDPDASHHYHETPRAHPDSRPMVQHNPHMGNYGHGHPAAHHASPRGYGIRGDIYDRSGASPLRPYV